jgi:hypothetical protein
MLVVMRVGKTVVKMVEWMVVMWVDVMVVMMVVKKG